jgi:TetR/AcrR family transcriptional regulator
LAGKKERILQTGTRLFLRDGIHAVSMEQIAEEAPVSKMTIYKYFQSKEGLLQQVVGQLVNRALEDFRRLVADAGSPLDALIAIGSMNDMEGISETFIQDLLIGYPEQARELLEFQGKHIFPVFEELVLRAQREGYIRKDLSPHVLVLFLMSMKEFFAKPDIIAGITNMRAVSEQLVSILYHGILTDEHKQTDPKSRT